MDSKKLTILDGNALVCDLFDESGNLCRVALYAGSVGDLDFDVKGIARRKYKNDLVVGNMVMEYGGYTNNPETSGNWGVFLRVLSNETRATSFFLTIQTARQILDGTLVSPSIVPIGCDEVVIQDPRLKEVFSSYVLKGNNNIEMHDAVGVVNVFIQLAQKPAPVVTRSSVNRTRGGGTRSMNAEMGAGDATNRTFAISHDVTFATGVKVSFRVKPLRKGNENAKMGSFTQVGVASAFHPDSDDEGEDFVNTKFKQIEN